MRVLVDASSMSSLSENVLCDALLERVFFSLLSNAVKFSPQNGAVVVTITHNIPGSDNHPTNPAQVTGGADQQPSGSVKQKQSSTDSGGGSLGAYTFHFRNSTVTPMRVAEVDFLS